MRLLMVARAAVRAGGSVFWAGYMLAQWAVPGIRMAGAELDTVLKKKYYY